LQKPQLNQTHPRLRSFSYFSFFSNNFLLKKLLYKSFRNICCINQRVIFFIESSFVQICRTKSDFVQLHSVRIYLGLARQLIQKFLSKSQRPIHMSA
jgi:hypothetical protein